MPHTVDETLYKLYLSALLAGERKQCEEIVLGLVAAGVRLKDLYINLFRRALYEVGVLWENHHISVAVEHLATAITGRMLTLVQAQTFSGQARDRTIIIACVADEYHQLGGRMIADFCELDGWRSPFLGANTPVADLLKLIEDRRPTLVGLSLSIYFNLPSLLKAIDAVNRQFPELPILVGGQAFLWGALDAVEDHPQVSFIASLDDLEQKLLAYEH